MLNWLLLLHWHYNSMYCHNPSPFVFLCLGYCITNHVQIINCFPCIWRHIVLCYWCLQRNSYRIVSCLIVSSEPRLNKTWKVISQNQCQKDYKDYFTARANTLNGYFYIFNSLINPFSSIAAFFYIKNHIFMAWKKQLPYCCFPSICWVRLESANSLKLMRWCNIFMKPK